MVYTHEKHQYNRLYIVWCYKVYKNCDIASTFDFVLPGVLVGEGVTIERLKDELVGWCVLPVKGYRALNSNMAIKLIYRKR